MKLELNSFYKLIYEFDSNKSFMGYFYLYYIKKDPERGSFHYFRSWQFNNESKTWKEQLEVLFLKQDFPYLTFEPIQDPDLLVMLALML